MLNQTHKLFVVALIGLAVSQAKATTLGSFTITQSGCVSSAPTGPTAVIVGGQPNADGSLYLNSISFESDFSRSSTQTTPLSWVTIQFYSNNVAFVNDASAQYFNGATGQAQGTWTGSFNVQGTAWVVNAQAAVSGCTMRFQGTAYNIGN